jgi:cell division protease FtsH
MTKGELIARITGFLGGRSSEEVFFNDISTGASNDIEQATRIARAMVVEYGMSSLGPIQYESHTGSVFLGRDYTSSQKNFSGAVANEIDREVRNIVETAHENAIKIITEHREDVELIAEALLEHETLNGEEIDYLLKNRKMPEYRKTTPDYSKPVVEEKKETSISEFNPVIVFPGDEIEENSSKEENKEEE